jgi:uncharacterized protein (DUF433 family)
VTRDEIDFNLLLDLDLSHGAFHFALHDPSIQNLKATHASTPYHKRLLMRGKQWPLRLTRRFLHFPTSAIGCARGFPGKQTCATMHSMSLSDLITADPEILGGVPVFKGTRVPVKTLFEYLEKNYTLEEFLECFPSVTREMACKVLERSEHALLAPV